MNEYSGLLLCNFDIGDGIMQLTKVTKLIAISNKNSHYKASSGDCIMCITLAPDR